jgi:hypothetical protein
VVHLKRLHKQYGKGVAFVFIAVPEAGHTIPGYEYLLAPPRYLQSEEGRTQRCRCIRRAMQQAGLSLPGFLDTPDHSASRAYAGFPRRLVVVDTRGRIARDFGPGFRRRWDWQEVARLLDALTDGNPPGTHATSARRERFSRPFHRLTPKSGRISDLPRRGRAPVGRLS